MIIDRTHRGWLIVSLIFLVTGGALYVPYAFFAVSGVSGGSFPGLIYASVGSAMMVFAGLLGARKKYRIWRLGRATWWMRGHLWIGFLSFPFILFHSGFRLGNGALTKILMLLFVIVFLSGILGAVLQHFVPQAMTQRVPMETIYDQIDRVIGQLVDESALTVSEIVAAVERELERDEQSEEIQSPARSGKATAAVLVDERISKKVMSFFESQLKPYLLSRGSSSALLANPVQAGIAFQQLKVLVPKNLWPKFDDLENICEEKRELERQRRLHRFLHGWLLFHIPASYALLLLGAIHAVVALRY